MPAPKRPEPKITTVGPSQKEIDRFTFVLVSIIAVIVVLTVWAAVSGVQSGNRQEAAEVYCLDLGYTSAVVYDEEAFCLRTVNGTEQVRRIEGTLK